MNLLLILLGIIIVLVLYYVYIWYFSTRSFTSLINLKNNNPIIQPTYIASPASTKFAFGTWLFVQSLPSAETVLFNFRSNETNKCVLKITSAGILRANIDGISTNFEFNDAQNPISLSKWIYLVISVNDKFADLYLDGKLVKTQQFQGSVVSADPKTAIISFSPSITNIYLSKLMRWATPLDSLTVWDYYMEGNGASDQGLFGSNHLGITISNTSDNDRKYYKVV